MMAVKTTPTTPITATLKGSSKPNKNSCITPLFIFLLPDDLHPVLDQ